MNVLPHGCVGRIGAEYDLYDEKWKLHRVDVDDDGTQSYVFRGLKRGAAFVILSLHKFLKKTKYWDGARMPTTPYRIPCFQCRQPISGRCGSLFCDGCRPC